MMLEFRNAGIVIIAEAATSTMQAIGVPQSEITAYLQQRQQDLLSGLGSPLYLVGFKKFYPGILGINRSTTATILRDHPRALGQQLKFGSPVRFEPRNDILYFTSPRVLEAFLEKSNLADLRALNVDRFAISSLCFRPHCAHDVWAWQAVKTEISASTEATLRQALRFFANIKVVYLVADCDHNMEVDKDFTDAVDLFMNSMQEVWSQWEKAGVSGFVRWDAPQIVLTTKGALMSTHLRG